MLAIVTFLLLKTVGRGCLPTKKRKECLYTYLLTLHTMHLESYSSRFVWLSINVWFWRWQRVNLSNRYELI